MAVFERVLCWLAIVAASLRGRVTYPVFSASEILSVILIPQGSGGFQASGFRGLRLLPWRVKRHFTLNSFLRSDRREPSVGPSSQRRISDTLASSIASLHHLEGD